MNSTSILYVDSYHGSDSIFVNDLARSLSHWHKLNRSAIIVHNPSEHVQRFLEAKGIVYPDDSAPVVGGRGNEWSAEIQRIVVESNRRLVGQLTEFGVSAVAVSGADRSIISVNSQTIEVDLTWLLRLAIPGVVPVLAPIGRSGSDVVTVSAGDVLNSFAKRPECEIVTFPRNGRFSVSSGFELASEGANGPELFYDFDEIRRISKSVQLFLTHPKGLKSAKMDGKRILVSDFV